VNRAKWFLMTGERVTGEQLHELGPVNFLVPDDEILKHALACADKLAAGPAAISASKVPINQYIRMVSNLVLPLRSAPKRRRSAARTLARHSALRREARAELHGSLSEGGSGMSTFEHDGVELVYDESGAADRRPSS
jgi:enoyl-CoA hydratase/carnithine racemase